MSKKDKGKHNNQTKHSKKRIKHAAWWALGIGIIGTIVYLAVTAPKVDAGEYESMAGIHYHAHLTITVNGEDVPLPAQIGAIATGFNPLHTHADDNIIHMEFEDATNQKVKKDDIRLGKFFDVWNKDWTASSFMGNPIDDSHTLVMKVNGLVSAEYRHYLMRDKDQIELTYQ